jgi:flagellar motor switch protein FliM
MFMLASVIITSGNVGGLILWLVGVLICAAIVYAIMRAIAVPPWAFTVLYVIALVLLLILTVDFFFGGSGTVTVNRP